jgi:hypothetical protein
MKNTGQAARRDLGGGAGCGSGSGAGVTTGTASGGSDCGGSGGRVSVSLIPKHPPYNSASKSASVGAVATRICAQGKRCNAVATGRLSASAVMASVAGGASLIKAFAVSA